MQTPSLASIGFLCGFFEVLVPVHSNSNHIISYISASECAFEKEKFFWSNFKRKQFGHRSGADKSEIKFDFWGESLSGQEVAYLTKNVDRKNIIVPLIAFRVWIRSKKISKKKFSGYVLQLLNYGYLKFSIGPQRSNLTSEVKNHPSKNLHIWLKDFA